MAGSLKKGKVETDGPRGPGSPHQQTGKISSSLITEVEPFCDVLDYGFQRTKNIYIILEEKAT